MSDQDENVTAVSPTVDPFATSPVDSSSEDAAIAVELDEILEEAVVAVEEAIVEAIEDAEEEIDPVVAFREQMRSAPGDWFVIHSYAGYENKVKGNL